MPADHIEPSKLTCTTCGNHQEVELTPDEINELFSQEQLFRFCLTCQTVTSWYGVQHDRRAGQERRKLRQIHVKLRIQVRCELPALEFTEVTLTETASRDGASFTTRHALREGMQLFVVMPFSEVDPMSVEVPARVVYAEVEGNRCHVGVEFLKRR